MFYWSRDGPSLKTCFGEDLEDLDYLRQQYRIHVYMQSELPNYICLASETAFDTAEITQKLRELWKQKVARLEFRIKAYMMEPPERNPRADQVAITKQDGAALANLHLTQAREFKSKLGTLAKGMSCLPESNHKRIRDGLNACMSRIKHLNTDMRLRIKFGSFVHDRWKGGGGTDAIYPLNEFPGLLSDDRWQGRLVPGYVYNFLSHPLKKILILT